MNYIAGQIYEFEVIKDYGEDEDFFRLRLQGIYEGRLRKLKFQCSEPLPDKLRCRVKYVNNDVPVISHYMPQYVNRFYAQGAMHGREFEFTVIAQPSRAGDPYVLEDKYGMRYNLRDGGATLEPGQTVMCRFTKLTDTFFNLVRVRADMRLPLVSAETLLAGIGVKGIVRDYVMKAIATEPALADAYEEMRHGNPLWVITALQAGADSIPRMLSHTDMSRHYSFLQAVLAAVGNAALFLIENSRFLRNQPASQRRELQTRLTRLVESLEPYGRVLELFRNDSQEEFVESIMEKLRESGYLYHPARQFAILMMILRADPGLVRMYLGRIFDTIMEWPLETWTTEPFRSAFVGQFEIYIRHASAALQQLPQAESDADKDLLEKIVTAVALQTLISGDAGDERRRNRSLLYRCIALLRPVASDTLLDKAFLSVNGARLPVEYKYDHVRQPLMLMTRAMVAPAAECALSTEASFRSGHIMVSVGPDGVTLRRTDEITEARALPAGLLPWKLAQPQIYLDNIPALTGSKLNNLEAHRRMWSDIETALTEERVSAQPAGAERRKADIGDELLVIINPDATVRDDDPCWQVRIDDENFLPGTGTIRRSDIVDFNLRGLDLDYSPRIAREAFVADDGRPRHFVAAVTGVTDSGEFTFRMSDDIDAQVSELLDFNQTYLAVVTQKLDYEYRCISETGYGFYLQRDRGADEYRPGSVVQFRLLDISNPSHLSGTIIGPADDGERVTKIMAFRNLMSAISVEPEASRREETPEQYADVADDTLSAEDIFELIEIFRFKALSSSAILEAYDYLLFARTLAIAVGHATLAEDLRTHASLLRLHQFYATNSRIDADELETLRPKVAGRPLLEIMFHRLEIVSWLGRADNDSLLWETVNASRNNLENTLARLVLAYNMLPDGEHGDPTVSRGLKLKIAGLLGVNFERTNLKSYGRENQFVEFKSSIVYPARKNKSDKVEADPERQQRVILKIIAGFMNSSGGTLYIGVNDASHCAAGLFEDFEYYKHHRAYSGTHYFDVKTPDNMCVFLENLVRDTWGNIVAASVQIRTDDEAERDVIVVEVQPRLTPVKLDDRIFVRRSSSTVALTDDECAEFTAERKAMELRRREELKLAGAAPADAEAPAPGTATDVVPDVPGVEKIATSRWRNNVQHTYEDGFASPSGYLYFNSDGTVTFSRQDLYIDTDPSCRLALAISADEEQHGFLVAVYEGQRILKVPVQEIVEKGENRPFGIYADAPLLFISVAMPDQGVMLILTDSRGNLYRRTVLMGEITPRHLTGTPERVLDIAGSIGTRAVEIVAASSLPYFEQSTRAKMSSRQIGYTLKCSESQPKATRIVEQELSQCR